MSTMRLWGIEWTGSEAEVLKDRSYRLMVVRDLKYHKDEILAQCLEFPTLKGRIIARIIRNPDAYRQALIHDD